MQRVQFPIGQATINVLQRVQILLVRQYERRACPFASGYLIPGHTDEPPLHSAKAATLPSTKVRWLLMHLARPVSRSMEEYIASADSMSSPPGLPCVERLLGKCLFPTSLPASTQSLSGVDWCRGYASQCRLIGASLVSRHCYSLSTGT